MARVKDPHEAALKAWRTRKRNAEQRAAALAAQAAGAGAPAPPAAHGPQQARGDWRADRWADKEKRMSTTPAKEIVSLASKKDRGVSESYEMRLEDGTHGNFKPASGELSDCRDGIDKGQMPERELAAWEVAKIVGMDDMVAPVVIREFDVPGGGHSPRGDPYLPGKKKGSFAEWQEGELARAVGGRAMYDGQEDAVRAALYDYVIGNMDRHAKNWVVTTEGRIKLIDHGLAFGENDKMDGGGNYILMAHATRDIGGRPPKAEIEKYTKNKGAILEALKRTGLPRAAIEQVGKRIDGMAGATDYSFFDRVIAPPRDPFAMLLGMLGGARRP